MSTSSWQPSMESSTDQPEVEEGTSLASDWVVVHDSATDIRPGADHDRWDAAVSTGIAELGIDASERVSTQLEPQEALTKTEKVENNKEDKGDEYEDYRGGRHGQSGSEHDGREELDVCFICDCTGSMGSYIKAAQGSMQHIAEALSEHHGANLRLCVVSYRDHPPQDKTYVTHCSGFNTDLNMMQASVQDLKAAGGGDGPEALTAALHEALHAPWRPNATKVCILIADAPPHGLEPQGDGFPNGDPDGHDPLDILRDMATENIIVHAVGCEPALGKYQFARDFMCTVAELTGGEAIALKSADLLADVIVNGCTEELGLTKLQRHVEQEVRKVQVAARAAGRNIGTSQAVAAACRNLHASGVTTAQVDTDGRMIASTAGHWGSATDKKTLKTVKAELCACPPIPVGCALPRASQRSRLAAAGAAPPAVASPDGSSLPGADGATKAALRTDLISEGQVSRLVLRAQHQNRLL